MVYVDKSLFPEQILSVNILSDGKFSENRNKLLVETNMSKELCCIVDVANLYLIFINPDYPSPHVAFFSVCFECFSGKDYFQVPDWCFKGFTTTSCFSMYIAV